MVTLSEWGDTQVACLQELGFGVSSTGDGGVSYEGIPEDQQGPLAVAVYECGIRYPVDPQYTVALTEDEVRYIFGYWIGALTRCLESEGYSIERPPSEETFVEQYTTSGPEWTPYDSLIGLSHSEWTRLNDECPQNPPGFRGW